MQIWPIYPDFDGLPWANHENKIPSILHFVKSRDLLWLRQQCDTKYEEVCHDVPETNCNDVQRQVQETVQEEQCQTVDERQCSTVYETQCDDVNEEQCSTVLVKNGSFWKLFLALIDDNIEQKITVSIFTYLIEDYGHFISDQ